VGGSVKQNTSIEFKNEFGSITMKRGFMKILVLICSFCFLSLNCFSKDLTHRLGVGFKNNTSQDLPTLAAVYYSSSDFALTGGLGLDTKKDYSSFQASGGIRYIIYPETNMNFYSAGEVSLVNYENPVDGKKNGVEVAGLFGVEFFLAGLENLGFTIEAGLSMATANTTRFRTVGNDPFHAGLIFYF
jgi:hypothetical protein